MIFFNTRSTLRSRSPRFPAALLRFPLRSRSAHMLWQTDKQTDRHSTGGADRRPPAAIGFDARVDWIQGLQSADFPAVWVYSRSVKTDVADLRTDSRSQTTTNCGRGRGSLIAVRGQTRTENCRIRTSLNYTSIRLSSHKCVINSVFSVQCLYPVLIMQCLLSRIQSVKLS